MLFRSHLARAGTQLSVLARGDTLAAVQRQDLQLHQGGQHHSVAVRASQDAAELGVQDLVVVAVKAPALASVATQIGPLLGPHTVVLTAMNGVPWWFFQQLDGPCKGLQLQSVDPGGRVAALIPADRVIGSVVHASCATPEIGRAHV